ncbi:MAG: glycosyltransferase [Lachnospiraceae bacterium]|nr:glycosyltransferase [Lachnospiraceae bacterium]
MPVYNMEEYISSTIENWLKQSLIEKELVCIDDCSTDNTYAILCDFADKHPEVIVFRQPNNMGAGLARNKAIEMARGEYISILDADDMYEDVHSLKKIYDALNQDKCDVGSGLFSYYKGENRIELDRFRHLFSHGENIVDVDYKSFQEDYCYHSFIFRKEYLVGNGIFFPNLRRYQDPPFLVRALYYANCIRVVNVEFYGYKIGYKGLNLSYDIVRDLFEGFLMNLKFADDNGLEILIRKTVDRLNIEYWHVWSRAIHLIDNELLIQICKAEKIAKKHKLHIHLAGYFLYRQQDSEKFNMYDITMPYPIDDCSVDSYQAEDVLEHIEKSKIVSVINEIWRVLKPGGIFRLSLPDYNCFYMRQRCFTNDKKEPVFDPMGGGAFISGKVVDGGHLWFPVYSEVKKLLDETRFKKIIFYRYHLSDGSSISKEIDYSKGMVLRTKENDKRNLDLSIVVDCEK